MFELKGTVVLITGAAKGIGAAFVKVLMEQGVKHIRILDIDETEGVFLQDELNEKHGADVIKFTKCDVTNDEELFNAFKDTTEQNGYIDLVVNNAGANNESNSYFIRKQLDVNVTALINGTLKAIELMRIDKGGRGGTVINVSSVLALIQHSPFLFVYAATKSAVLQFSSCIGMEPYHSKTGVRVITMCFGATDTSMKDKMASFDEGIKLKEIMASYQMQSAEDAANGTLEAFRRGESGSIWLVNNGKPAKDITSTMNKAYKDFAKLLEE